MECNRWSWRGREGERLLVELPDDDIDVLKRVRQAKRAG
jgi:hypothetical protein